jgi:hypothetical protein
MRGHAWASPLPWPSPIEGEGMPPAEMPLTDLPWSERGRGIERALGRPGGVRAMGRMIEHRCGRRVLPTRCERAWLIGLRLGGRVNTSP